MDYNSNSDPKTTLSDFILNQTILLNEKKEKLKFLKRALQDLNLNYSSFPLPLTAFNQITKESTEPNDGEEPCEVKIFKKAPTPDYNDEYNFLTKLGEHEEKRRKFAEERRKEYNEYLKEAKLTSSRLKLRDRRSDAFRLDSPGISYAELLDEKRKSEKMYRSLNDHFITTSQASVLEPDFFGHNAKRQKDSKLFDILSWQSKYPENGNVESLVPKNRFLATQSSRVKAAKYKEELLKQIEDKRRREEENKRQEKEEELRIEKRIQEQRLRMMMEYEQEQCRLQKKADALARKQVIIKEMIEGKGVRETLPLTTPTPTPTTPRLPRSPSYHHVRQPKSPVAREVRASLESRFGVIHNQHLPSSPSFTSAIKSKALSPVISERGDESKIIAKNQSPPPGPARYDSPRASDVANHSPLTPNSSSREGRVLSRLYEVRRKMQEDHQRMLQQLNEQAQM